MHRLIVAAALAVMSISTIAAPLSGEVDPKADNRVKKAQIESKNNTITDKEVISAATDIRTAGETHCLRDIVAELVYKYDTTTLVGAVSEVMKDVRFNHHQQELGCGGSRGVGAPVHPSAGIGGMTGGVGTGRTASPS